MSADLLLDENLIQRLPFPLAQLCRRAVNAKSPRDRHDTSYYLWEAALKLLGSTAIVLYAGQNEQDSAAVAALQNLARPSVGHWLEFLRLLIPRLAAAGQAGCSVVQELLFGKPRADLPRAAGLGAALIEELDGKTAARPTVRLYDLFELLGRYRNREFGHGASGQKPAAYYERMGRALLLGISEALGKLDVLAGARLLYIADVRRRGDGTWLVERADLGRETYQRSESLGIPAEGATLLPRPERLYLEVPGAGDPLPRLRLLHPLVAFDADAGEVLFLNARRGKQRVEYLRYSTGRHVERAELAGEQRDLLRRVLNVPAEAVELDAWAERSRAEEGTDDAPPPAHRHLGEFELLSELGRGGMGVVYRAWQPSLGRQVALKCLLRSGDAKAEARFSREIQALGRVEHPNVVKIFTSGAEGERWFYSMELIEGTTLAAVCDVLHSKGSSARDVDLSTWQQMVSTACEEERSKEKPLEDTAADHVPTSTAARSTTPSEGAAGMSYVRHVAKLVRQVAEAAQALHERGIVHRDIKPGNIMVDPEGGTAVLMDLGLAQVADEVEGRLTKTRQFVGTLRQASPEQVLAVARLDGRSDVYSLGATLWELLTLRPLYGATEQMPTPDLMMKIQQEEPERVRAHNAAVPRDLAAIVEKCLQKNPARRYESAQELEKELGRFLDGKPVQARPVTSLERSWKWARRKPALSALCAVLVTAVIVGVNASVAFTLSINEARQNAENLAGKEKEQRTEAEKKTKEVESQKRLLESQKAELQQSQRITRETGFRMSRALSQAAVAAWDAGQVERTWSYYHEIALEDRGWESDYLRRRFKGSYATLFGHAGAVNGVAFSPDGRRIASASDDGTLRVWDAALGAELLTIEGHTGPVESVAFSPDGERIVSGSGPTAAVWTAGGGTKLLTIGGHTNDVVGVAYSPDGRRIVSGSRDGTAKVWGAEDGAQLLTLKGHSGPVYAVAFSPDGRRLASGGEDTTVRVWDADTGTESQALKGHTGPVYAVAFSPDGRRLASGGEDTTVRVWDADSGRELLSLQGHSSSVRSLAFSPEGRHIASASSDQTLRIWEADNGAELLTLKGDTGSIEGVAYSPDGRRIVSGDWEGTLKVWDAKRGTELLAFRGHTDPVRSVAFSPDGQRVASASGDETVKLWDADKVSEIVTVKGHTGPVRSVAFSPDGKSVASGGGDLFRKPSEVKVWDTLTGRERLSLKGPAGSVGCVVFSHDNKRVASSSGDHTVRMWDADKGTELPTLKGHTETVDCVAFSPDGRRIVTGSYDHTAKVWDADTGLDKATLTGHTSVVSCAAISPDGKRVATGSWDGTAKVWNADTGQEVLNLKGHTSWVNSVAFSPDGKTVYTSESNSDDRAWDAQSGALLPVPKGFVFSTSRGLRNASRNLLAVVKDSEISIICVSPSDLTEQGYRQAMARFDPDWHKDKAQPYARDGSWFAAAFHFGQLAEHAPALKVPWEDLHNCCLRLGDPSPGLAVCDRLLRCDPTLSTAYFQRARLRANFLQFNEASADIILGRAAQSRRPGDAKEEAGLSPDE